MAAVRLAQQQGLAVEARGRSGSVQDCAARRLQGLRNASARRVPPPACRTAAQRRRRTRSKAGVAVDHPMTRRALLQECLGQAVRRADMVG